MKTVAQRWAAFEQVALPRGVGEVQRREMRRAFYAGFYDALNAGLDMAKESGDDDEAGAEMMQTLHDECMRFALDIGAGRA